MEPADHDADSARAHGIAKPVGLGRGGGQRRDGYEVGLLGQEMFDERFVDALGSVIPDVPRGRSGARERQRPKARQRGDRRAAPSQTGQSRAQLGELPLAHAEARHVHETHARHRRRC